MFKIRVLLLAVFSLVSISAAHGIFKIIAAPRGMQENIQDAARQITERMCREIPELGLPPLDPLDVEHLAFNLDNKLGKIDGEINNVTFELLRGLNVPKFDLKVLTLKFDFHVNLPSILITGKYKANGTLGELLDLDGEGDLSVFIKNINIKGNGGLKYSSQEKQIYLDTILIIPSIEETDIRMEGLHPNPIVNDFINYALNDLAPELVPELWQEFEDDLYGMAKALIKEQLAGVSVSDLIAMMGKPLFDPPLGGPVCEY